MRMFSLAAIVFAALCGSAICGPALAYDFETTAVYSNAKADFARFDIHNFGVSGTAYFETVESNGVALEEAAFAQRVGALTVGYSYTDPGAIEFSTLSLSGEWWVNDLYISGSFAQLDAEEYGSNDAYSAELGFAPTRQSLIAVGLVNDGVETDQSIRGKLMKSRSSEVFKFSYVRSDFVSVTELGIDSYIDPTLKIGFLVMKADNDYAFGADVRKFFNTSLSVSLGVRTGDETEVLSVGSAIRF